MRLYGILLSGAGQVWLNGAKLETVDSDVPLTSTNEESLPDTPVNLDLHD
jgi:hypothetical protein